jgi:hypothetical protein
MTEETSTDYFANFDDSTIQTKKWCPGASIHSTASRRAPINR